MQNLLTNWKTSSAGFSMMALAILHLVFQIKAGNADETTWTRTITAVIGGIGLIFAGDAAASKKEVADTKADVKKAIDSGDTSILKNEKEKTATDQTVTTPPKIG